MEGFLARPITIAAKSWPMPCAHPPTWTLQKPILYRKNMHKQQKCANLLVWNVFLVWYFSKKFFTATVAMAQARTEVPAQRTACLRWFWIVLLYKKQWMSQGKNCWKGVGLGEPFCLGRVNLGGKVQMTCRGARHTLVGWGIRKCCWASRSEQAKRGVWPNHRHGPLQTFGAFWATSLRKSLRPQPSKRRATILDHAGKHVCYSMFAVQAEQVVRTVAWFPASIELTGEERNSLPGLCMNGCKKDSISLQT